MNALKLFKNIVFPHLWLNHNIGLGAAAILGGSSILGGLLSGGDEAEPQLTGFAALPPWLQNQLRGAAGSAEDLFQGGGPQGFQGQTFADLDPNQVAGLNQNLGFAGGLQPSIDNIMGSFNAGINPNTVNDPAVQAMLGSIESRGNENLLENILPSIRRRAGIQGGEFGSRQDLTSGVAIGDAVGEIADAQGTFLGNQLNSARGLQGSLLGNAGSILGTGLLPGAIQQDVGGVFQNQDQLAILDEINRFNFEQQRPQLNLDNYLNRLGGLGGTGGGSGISPGQNTGVSTISGALAGGLLGNQLFNSLQSAPRTGGGLTSFGTATAQNPNPFGFSI